ncbi:hypothetical protein Ga0074812_101443 [Parafrankia irregularis]|uniref:GlsB/YeaQ/YmgE family stress response membrane protein n=1 Tax=Parafrankia irregularis TaxID=795642 RepID=A0A0S4QH24_9ACTN|nr:hypothetical protein [Parafrankia irregularis]MBE3206559.1 hypothetical protein [Parafrankia sp. CH37]CUU53942.1 hypothetical protein Ga0074812_101443 [Parafrankia irregularis]
MLWFVLTSIAVGLPVSVAARAVLPGSRPLALRTVAVLGILGALVGAAVGRALLGDGGLTAHPIRRELGGPVLGAALAVLIGWGFRLHTYRSGPRPPRVRPWSEHRDAAPQPVSATFARQPAAATRPPAAATRPSVTATQPSATRAQPPAASASPPD